MNNRTTVTVVGHVATDPRLRDVATGTKVTSFRLATTERRFDKALKEWRDGATMFFTVTCWRSLAENVFSSVTKGQPVVVQGRLHVSSYDDKDGILRNIIEIDAGVVGHDLSRGVSSFTKSDPVVRAEIDAAESAREVEGEEAPSYEAATGEIIHGGTPVAPVPSTAGLAGLA
jgi:single-strand DNA-binding protein